MGSRLQITAAAAFACIAMPYPARAEDNTLGVELIVHVSAWVMSHASGILASAYDKAPVVVTVLAAMLILPVTSLAALLIQSLRLKAKLHAAARSTGSLPAARTLTARLLADDGAVLALPLKPGPIRLGRHDDNDICLPYATVHRHHAVILRESDSAFSITDVSGTSGNGVMVNGCRVRDARLRRGDVIALGDASLTFDVASNKS